ncbi:HD domain-containing protein [Pseudonocardiaceae bacterium YIM PH 21723]|nr:HD domain-containing protein [Pseudonocardiaceae bacterium YIM PH 21723]
MAIAEFGTLAWAQARNGHMTNGERLRQLRASTRVLPAMVLGRAAGLVGIPARNTVRIDLDSIPFPDSAIAKEAEQECRDTVSPVLYNHSMRTYVFGMVLARRDGLEPDPELFFLASMLHDLTLGETHRAHAPMDCFAARGGLLAEEWTAARGLEPDRRATVSNAISMHLNTVVDPRFGGEAVALRAGAGVDTVGMRYRELDPASVAKVVERYPRCALKSDAALKFAAEPPGTRARFLRMCGFGLMLRFSPFAE